MTDYCGIDFGTSNSTLGILVDGKPQLVKLEHNHDTIPSAVFYEADSGEVVFGRQALDYYKNGYNGRLIRAFKSVLGSGLMEETTKVGKNSIYFSEIIESFLKHLKETAERKHNIKLNKAVIGRPIHFVDHKPEMDKKAEDSLKKAALNVGFEQVEFQYEPIAASLKYETSLKEDRTAMIIDIGGGTSDISIVKLSPKKTNKKDRSDDCIFNTGVHIGGTDFDTSLSLQSIMPLLGYRLPLKKNDLTIPNNFYTNLATWHKINLTSSLKYTLGLKNTRPSLKEFTHFDRLEKVVEEGLGFQIAMIVEEAKIHLSNLDCINQDLNFIEDDLSTEIHRSDLDVSTNKQIEDIIKTADMCIAKANLSISDIDSIFLTGGSSQMSIIKEKTSKHYKNTPIDNQEALSSVAIGLVIEAKNRFSDSS